MTLESNNNPLAGTPLRIESKVDLDEFLSEEGAADLVHRASFEEVFFTIKDIGLADCLDLLPLMTSRQIRGVVDLDCWRKDDFLQRPFMEWMAAFIQAGPEQGVRALSSIDEAVVSLFLKDTVEVHDIDRDDPPHQTQLIFTPDNRFGVEPLSEGDGPSMAVQVLDALFKYNPKLAGKFLSTVRYMTRMEIEEVAFDNRNRRLEAHGFVDYYEALSIYGAAENSRSDAGRTKPIEDIPGEELPGTLPAVFIDSLAGAPFLLEAFRNVTDPAEANRLAQELTALGNRVLSANLVTLGEVEHVRPALEEMRDTLNIGMELMTGGKATHAGPVLKSSYIQTVFKNGFDRLARLREKAHAVAQIPRFVPAMLDTTDREFIEALRHFKPLLTGPKEGTTPHRFRTVAEIESAEARLTAIAKMIPAFLEVFPAIADSFIRTFNTAVLQQAAGSPFEPIALDPVAVAAFLEKGFASLKPIPLDAALAPFAERWIETMRAELEPLRGQRIDPRFIGSVIVKL